MATGMPASGPSAWPISTLRIHGPCLFECGGLIDVQERLNPAIAALDGVEERAGNGLGRLALILGGEQFGHGAVGGSGHGSVENGRDAEIVATAIRGVGQSVVHGQRGPRLIGAKDIVNRERNAREVRRRRC